MRPADKDDLGRRHTVSIYVINLALMQIIRNLCSSDPPSNRENGHGLAGRFISSSTIRQAYELVDRYPVGSQVTVYYDLDDPSQAALRR